MLSQSQHNQWQSEQLARPSGKPTSNQNYLQPSKVDSRYSILERQVALAHVFSLNFELAVVSLKKGDVNSHCVTNLRKVVSDPDFDIHFPIERWKNSPLIMLCHLANADGFAADSPYNHWSVTLPDESRAIVSFEEDLRGELTSLSQQGLIPCGANIGLSQDGSVVSAPNDQVAHVVGKALSAIRDFALKVDSKVTGSAKYISDSAGSLALDLLRLAIASGKDLTLETPYYRQSNGSYLKTPCLSELFNFDVADLILDQGANYYYDKTVDAHPILEKVAYRFIGIGALFEITDGGSNLSALKGCRQYYSAHDFIEKFFLSGDCSALRKVGFKGDLIAMTLNTSQSCRDGFSLMMLQAAKLAGYPFAETRIIWDRVSPEILGDDLLFNYVEAFSAFGDGRIDPDICRFLLQNGLDPYRTNPRALVQYFPDLSQSDAQTRATVRGILKQDLESIDSDMNDQTEDSSIEFYGPRKNERELIIDMIEGRR